MLILKSHLGTKVLTRLFFLFIIPGWNFIPVFLTGVSLSWDEISSRQKRVNSKRHFTIDRNDFILGRVSSWDEISRVNTLWEDKKLDLDKTGIFIVYVISYNLGLKLFSKKLFWIFDLRHKIGIRERSIANTRLILNGRNFSWAYITAEVPSLLYYS